MTRNDTFFKILFAIELALLPMVFFAQMLLPDWSMGLFVAGILVAKIWVELFKNKTFAHTLINAIGSIVVFSTLLIFFMSLGLINVVLGIFAVVFIVLTNIFKVVLHNKAMPETIEAIDFCYTLFEILTLVAFTFLVFYSLITSIGLFAILLTAVVSVAYKVFYVFKYMDVFGKLKKLFRRK